MQPNKTVNDFLLFFFRMVGLASSHQLRLADGTKTVRKPRKIIRIFNWLKSLLPKRTKPLLLADLRTEAKRLNDDMAVAAEADITSAKQEQAPASTSSSNSLDGLDVAMNVVHQLAEGGDSTVNAQTGAQADSDGENHSEAADESDFQEKEITPPWWDADACNKAAVSDEERSAACKAMYGPKEKVATPEPEAPKALLDVTKTFQASLTVDERKKAFDAMYGAVKSEKTDPPKTLEATPKKKRAVRMPINSTFDDLIKKTDFTPLPRAEPVMKLPELTDEQKYPTPVFNEVKLVDIFSGAPQ